MAVDTPLEARAEAARQLIADDELDPLVGLSFVVWPSRALADRTVSRRHRYRRWTDEHKRACIELAAQGVPSTEIARLVLDDERRYSSVRRWVRDANV